MCQLNHSTSMLLCPTIRTHIPRRSSAPVSTQTHFSFDLHTKDLTGTCLQGTGRLWRLQRALTEGLQLGQHLLAGKRGDCYAVVGHIYIHVNALLHATVQAGRFCTALGCACMKGLHHMRQLRFQLFLQPYELSPCGEVLILHLLPIRLYMRSPQRVHPLDRQRKQPSSQSHGRHYVLHLLLCSAQRPHSTREC